MENGEYVDRLRSHLDGSERFVVKQGSDLSWNIESSQCRIAVVFDRYEAGDPVVTISAPSSDAQKMSLFLLRHMRHAGQEFSVANSPETLARMLSLRFSDLLSGDFSIQREYAALSRRFFTLSFEVDMLLDTDPVKRKFADFDIAWLEDLLKRKGQSL